MTLRRLGELGLIARVARAAARTRGSRPHVVVDIGDDAAVLKLRRGERVVVSTDASVEWVHFRFDAASPRTIGQRALLGAISDLAAMGARPIGCVAALAAPPGLAVARVDGLVRGLLDIGEVAGCPLVGGNMARARDTSLTLTVLGAAGPGSLLRRDAARPGDRLLVTGVLGAAALARARGGAAARRQRPPLRLAAGRALARLAARGACIDVSDGLLADLDHVLEASGVGAVLDVARVPRPRGLEAACARLGISPAALVLTGGEDYELLFTLRPGGPVPGALARRLGAPVTEIGRIVRRGGLRLVGAPPGALAALRSGPAGWRHF